MNRRSFFRGFGVGLLGAAVPALAVEPSEPQQTEEDRKALIKEIAEAVWNTPIRTVALQSSVTSAIAVSCFQEK